MPRVGFGPAIPKRKLVTNLIYPINEVCQVSSHPKTVLFVKLPAIGTFPIFVVRVFGVLSTVTLAVVLNSEIFIAFVLGHSSTLVNSQVHVLPHDLISEVCVMIGKSSIEIIPKTTNWLRIWYRFCEKNCYHLDSLIYFPYVI